MEAVAAAASNAENANGRLSRGTVSREILTVKNWPGIGAETVSSHENVISKKSLQIERLERMVEVNCFIEAYQRKYIIDQRESFHLAPSNHSSYNINIFLRRVQ
jgi:hypothetical protein